MPMESSTYIGPYLEMDKKDYDDSILDCNIDNIENILQNRINNSSNTECLHPSTKQFNNVEQRIFYNEDYDFVFEIEQNTIEKEISLFLEIVYDFASYLNKNNIKYEIKYGIIKDVF